MVADKNVADNVAGKCTKVADKLFGELTNSNNRHFSDRGKMQIGLYTLITWTRSTDAKKPGQTRGGLLLK